MRLIINDVEMDVIERDIVARYAISKLFDFTAPATTRTDEIELPKTSKNLAAIGYADVLLNDSTTVFNLLDAQLYVDGVDMQIEKAQIVSVNKTIKVRLFGQNVSFFAAIADKYIDELDLSALDHTWDFTTVTSNLQNPSGFLYPIIDYADILETGSDVNAEALYPAVFANDIIQQIATDAGYTIDGDLTTDADFLTEIVPFSNKETKSLTDTEFDSLGFSASKQSGTQTITVASGGAKITFDTLDSGSGYSPSEYDIPYDANYALGVTVYGTAAASPDQYYLKLYRKQPAIPEELLETRPISLTSGTPTYVGVVFNSYYFAAGDEAYVKLTPIPFVTTQDATLQTGYFTGTTIAKTRFYLSEAVNNVGFGQPWRVGINLPKIKQSDFLKQYVKDYGCLVTVNERTKTVTFKKISTVKNATAVDWSAKVDWKTPDISFTQQLAQNNILKYQDDDNVTKTRGVDNTYVVSDTSLPPSQTFIEAVFGATQTGIYLDQGVRIPIIERLGSNPAKPRRLVSNETSDVEIRIYSDSESVDISTTDVNIPYFIDATKDFDLRYFTFCQGKTAEMLSTLTNMRTVTLPLRLTPADINQLDFLRPVYIERYGVNFLVIDIEYNFTRRTATAKLLVI